MDNSGIKYTVPIKNLKEAQKLPPQWLFDNAQGVLSHLAVKIKPKNQFLKIVNRKTFASLPVYLVLNYGYIFVYTKKEFGYALNVKAAGKIDKQENIKKNTTFRGQISIPFKNTQLKLAFEDSKGYDLWVNLLEVICDPDIDQEWREKHGFKRAGYTFKHDEQVIAEWVKPPVGQKKDSEWAEVRRYASNTVDPNATVFEETILEYEVTTEFSPTRSSTRRDEYELDLEDDLDDGNEVFEEENFGDEEELFYPAAPPLLNRTPSTRSSIRSGRRQLQGSAPLIQEEEYHGGFSRCESPARSIARTPSTSRAPSLRSEARAASPISLRNPSFNQSNEERVIYVHSSPARPISRTPSRAPTPRRAVAAAQPPRYY